MGAEGREGWCGIGRVVVGAQGECICAVIGYADNVPQQFSTALGLLEDLYPSPAKDAQITQDQLHALTIRFLIHLCLGTTHHAAALFPLLELSAIPQEKKDILQGLLWTCQGRAGDVVARAGIRSDSEGMVDLVVANNEAVAMLETGALTEVSVAQYFKAGLC